MSIKRRIKDLREFDFDRAMEMLTLKNQGWTQKDIGAALGVTQQRVQQNLKQIGSMTVEEAELYRGVFDYLSKLPIV